MAKDRESSNAAVIRVHKDKQYTVMSNEHLLFKKPPLSLKAKGLLSMFLALPDDWNYSISGISSICKESRDCIRSTISELIDHGYLQIEKQNGDSGRFIYIYHIFERSQKLLPDTENPHLENPIPDNPIPEQPAAETSTQLNTNKQNTNKQNTNKLNTKDLIELYKSICIDYPQPQKLNDEREKKAKKRLESYPDKEFWTVVFEKAEKSDFCRKNSFFNFDWVIKNDTNPQKIYEGNYDNRSGSNVIPAQSFAANNSGSKYSNYHSKGGV